MPTWSKRSVIVSTLYALITSRTHCSYFIFTDFLTWNVRAQAQKSINKAYHTNKRGNYQKICVKSKPGKVKGNLHKCFTCVTKTIANLTKYSRKPGNYNGTIIFEIDIMKNSSPINLNLCQTWLFHNCFGCFFCFDLLWAELRVQWVQQKRIAVLVLTWQKVWILNWVGMSFSWCQSQK